jgi:tRNA threonylcarbamoyl adenosine modification protein YeaZ
MKILALELSTARGSLAYLSDNADAVRDWPNNRKNSATFFANIVDVQTQFGSAEKIIVGLGPGSYAGTRIAISVTVGLQFACGAELLGLPSICAIECDAGEYCVIGDARRQSFFFARICANDLVEGAELLAETDLRAKMEMLDEKMPIFASEELPHFPRIQVRYPSARVLARLAQDANRRFVVPPLEPIYLREPHITFPKST